MPTITLRDQSGGLKWNGTTQGEVDYATGELIFDPDAIVKLPKAVYKRQELGEDRAPQPDGSTKVTKRWRTVLDKVEDFDTFCTYPPEGGDVTVTYRTAADVGQTASETTTLSSLVMDLTPGYAEVITPGSLRLKLGSATYVEKGGFVYRNPDAATGAGILSGSLDPTSGRLTLNAWIAGEANAIVVESLITEVGCQPVDAASWRTPVAPIKVGSMQLRFQDVMGNLYLKTVGLDGKLEDNHCTINVDYERGVVHCRFGQWIAVADLTPEDLLQPWYANGVIVDRLEVPSVWRPKMIVASSIVYNAVASTYLPPDSELLGLDAARLPPDGRALIFRRGMLVLAHHTDSLAVSALSPTQAIDCGRTRLYRVAIEDATGKRLGTEQYTINRELGVVTMGANLDLTGYTAPFAVRHTVADLARVVSTDINGLLTLLSPVSHAYPADESYVSGVLFAGTLQARVSNLFSQTAWTSEWSDARIGTVPLAQYNDALYPIQIANAGAYPDRFLIRFTSATAFQVIGENLGLIGVGDINTDCEPINSLTEQAYFRIDKRGWGAGWATGNCLRFNVHAACYPVDLVRAVQPSQPTGLVDSAEMILIGNVDNTGA